MTSTRSRTPDPTDPAREEAAVQTTGQGRSVVDNAQVNLFCHDVDTVYACALQIGGASLREPMDGSAGRLRYAWVLDPEGLQIRILQDLQERKP